MCVNTKSNCCFIISRTSEAIYLAGAVVAVPINQREREHSKDSRVRKRLRQVVRRHLRGGPLRRWNCCRGLLAFASEPAEEQPFEPNFLQRR